MLRSLRDLQGYAVAAKDGPVGRIHDFYFDDAVWVVRYVVVDTGHWLPGRRVLLSPEALAKPEWPQRRFPTDLTQRQIESSPPISDHRPVSRQHEADLREHYGWQPYWPDQLLYGHEAARVYDQGLEPAAVEIADDEDDPHLRSHREVRGYRVHAADGVIGHVDDFIVDDQTWTLRYAVVSLHQWRPGKKVLVSPAWVTSVDWAGMLVHVDHSRGDLEQCPTFDPSLPVNREYEERLYDYLGRPRYW